MSLIRFIKAKFLMSMVKDQLDFIDFNNIKSVLFLKYDKIGDMVVCTPAFRELKKACPHMQISVLASKINQDILSNNPYIDKIYI